ncbi:MAG: galactose-1-phosphate uridylyltransferase [Clostridia bacterium]|nr:galactose-1-phosphate uridylyltransferase [Clostridia bacterium]
MKIYKEISRLLAFAKARLGLSPADEAFVRNSIIDALGLTTFEENDVEAPKCDVSEVLAEFSAVGVEEGVFTAELAPYFCDKIMGMLSLRPSYLNQEFHRVYEEKGAAAATEWLYTYCVDNNYVKKAVLDKNPRFDAENGLVVTINLAKPEFRDPNKAKSGNAVAGGYPKCVICRDNEGFAPRGKFTLRTVSLNLNGKPWFWQFSPYGYFYQHGICVNKEHIPMHIDRDTFVNLMDFVDMFPHYFIGCNACLERIGGSVLAHDHYQGGGEVLPLFKAGIKQEFTLKGYEDLKMGILDWPGTVLRIVGTDRNKIIEVCEKVRANWVNYTDKALSIVCKDEAGQHNSISPTVVKRNGKYEFNIILRSNITSEQYPDGIFHAHPEFHVIKKESIGLIEAQGLFILPGRLVKQLADLEKCIAAGKLTEELVDFKLLFDEVTAICGKDLSVSSVHEGIKKELASICYRILQNTAVFTSEQMGGYLEKMGFVKK